MHTNEGANSTDLRLSVSTDANEFSISQSLTNEPSKEDDSTTKNIVNTGKLQNQKVYLFSPSKKDPDHIKRFGRVHCFLFHPTKPQCVGFLVKRPDMALMFRRKDAFVSFDGFAIIDGRIIVSDSPKALGAGALKRMGIKLDDCVVWSGLPVMTQEGLTLGYVGSVRYIRETGQVEELEISQGVTANALLGKRIVKGSEIFGFKRGMGVPLNQSSTYDVEGAGEEDGFHDSDPDASRNTYSEDESNTRQDLGALLVADSVAESEVSGGVAEKAGESAALIADTAKKTYKKVVKEAKPKVDEATKVAGEAINKGVYAAGKQVGRASGMFGRFADEFKKGMKGE